MTMEITSSGRLPWIDMLRGYCMIAILLFHTEVYYTGDAVIPYSFYVDNVLTIFFFVSGYLFIKKGKTVDAAFVKHKLRSVVGGMLVPYFLLSAALSLPKSIVRGISLSQLLTDIVMGRAYWFVAALIVAEIIFLLLLWISRGNGLKMFLLVVNICAPLLPLTLHYCGGGLPWHAENALLAIPFLFAGYEYRRYEKDCERRCRWPYLLVAAAGLACAKIIEYTHLMPMCVDPINIGSWPLFFIDNALGIILAIAVVKRLPVVSRVAWTGAHSLVYYFLCSAVPLAVSMLFGRIGLTYSGMYSSILLVLVIGYAVSTVITWMVNKPLQKLRFLINS